MAREPADDPLAGTPYRTLRPLGDGAMGQVFVAEHVELGKRVAVKLLREELASVSGFFDRLRVEAQALARLDSPHIVTAHDFGVAPSGAPYLVMDLLEGRTLAAEIRDIGRIDPPRAISIVRSILEGLEAAHRAGLVHRDMKPENVLLTAAGPKILDFGVAKVLRGSSIAPPAVPTAPQTMVGTPKYMSPEQILAEPVDARADLYAVGMMLYVMLTGRHPFAGSKTLLELRQRQVSETPARPSAFAPVGASLDQAVLKSLAKRREDRFASAAEMSDALAGEGHAAPPVRPARRRAIRLAIDPAWFLLAAGTSIVVGGAILLWVWR